MRDWHDIAGAIALVTYREACPAKAGADGAKTGCTNVVAVDLADGREPWRTGGAPKGGVIGSGHSLGVFLDGAAERVRLGIVLKPLVAVTELRG
ncbi:hypothetical protein ABT096_17830 [Streptomyces sp. NPDC002561]|uniref:hypothetical protein n=1 Tax=Streptomyces sp. NPDC002561 TaxID=3154418 RepID=UPI00333450BB